MDELLKVVFKNYDLSLTPDEEKYFHFATIAEPYFSKTKNKLVFIFNVKNFLPIELIGKLENSFKSNSKIPASIKINVENNNNLTEDILWNFMIYIKEKKAEVKDGFVQLLNRNSFVYDENNKLILISTKNKTVNDFLEKHREYYSKKFIKYGFKDLHMKIILNDHNSNDLLENYIEDLKELEKKNSNLMKNKSFTIEKKDSNSQAAFSRPQKKSNLGFKKKLETEPPTYKNLDDLENNVPNIIIHAQVLKKEAKISKAGRYYVNLVLTDNVSSIFANFFAKNEEPTLFNDFNDEQMQSDFYLKHKDDLVKVGDWLAFSGDMRYSDFRRENVFYISNFIKIDEKVETHNRFDNAKEKRVELHTHTKMSTLDGVSSAKDYIETIANWGHKAIAITDHLNVQAFPEAYESLKKVNSKLDEDKKIKLIYGSHLNLLNDEIWYVKNSLSEKIDESRFVVFDLETTGLSPEEDEIIEFGAVVVDYKTGIKERHDILIKPKQSLSRFTTELTNITNEMLSDKKSIEEEFANIYNIISNGILVAHNANFDIGFLQSYCRKLGYPPLENGMLDTLTLSRVILPELKAHRLGVVAKKLGIFYDDSIAHRGDYDAEILMNVLEHLLQHIRKTNTVKTFDDLNNLAPKDMHDNLNFKRNKGHHITVLSKNQKGLKELYELISVSHVEDFFNSPKILKSHLLEKYTSGNLILGASCLDSEIFDQVMTGSYETVKNNLKNYDYIELQPLSACQHLWQRSDVTKERFQFFVKKLIALAKEENVKVVASSDAHYTEPSLAKIREVYINTKGLGGVPHPLFDYRGRIKDYPENYLRTTEEMLEEFSWLDDEKLIKEIVIENSNYIADQIDKDIIPIKSGSYRPIIENVDELLRDECYKNAHKIYGDVLPQIVEKRLEKELDSIIKHGFAVVYWISHKLVERSLNEGYLVGSRGSVGSSFVATTAKITEVNPLKAHYICDQCKYSNFDTPHGFKCGYDLPEKNCPNCNALLRGDGHDIPFETFLGFDGDKVPDIDLNFSSEYQPKAHNFTKEMFGEHNVFRAGTISTVADKTAYGYVKGYFEKKYGIDNLPRSVEIERIADLATGVKRTTGQHPGGIIILPKEYSIEDFTPVNYPADDSSSTWLTTHFDFHSIHDNLLKMDILGHVDPTALRMLKDLTGVDPIKISISDKKVYSLFSSPLELGIEPNQIQNEQTGVIGIPEFGTQFVRGMLKETKPKNFADLVQISGLSHGTDVWLNNAQKLIREGTANISTVIGCRDDIMVYLISMNLPSKEAFNIMESVRKGKGLTTENIKLLKDHDVPQWYIDSCLKIKYMFPKAHATAYVLMAYRIAWYKVYYPAEYYATFFSTRIDAMDLIKICAGFDAIKLHMQEIETKIAQNNPVTPKEKSLITTYEVALEMYARGIKMENIDFNLSAALNYTVKLNEDGIKSIIPPFGSIDSLGEALANSIVKARQEKPISSINDLKNRTQVTQTQMKLFEQMGVLSALSNDEQLTFNF
ncbi:PolC-type DNA polymerase III [Spiroplasma endosymbiont of Labia minor]|uniref:PolC-type DNA polymerase III n=1 Tax=Spiroplasma endosymbiont of Labia minor TaxID=3066305 RepID=UPI0030CA8B12